MSYEIKFLNGEVRTFDCLVGEDLGGANLEGANLEGADLRGVNLGNANLGWANLRGANLESADLEGADLRWANLYEANLYEANLRGADLRGADLRWANLGWANLRNVNLGGADLRWANLEGADLRGVNLGNANLGGANLEGADLRWVNLEGADLEGATGWKRNVYPEEGSFVCYKKCKVGSFYFIVTLKIPSKAKRIGAIGSRKFRVSEAKVIKIESMEGVLVNIVCTGKTYMGVDYQIGKIVKPDSFDDSDRIECSHGIHAFISKQEAKEW